MRASFPLFCVVTFSLASLAVSGCKKSEATAPVEPAKVYYQPLRPAVAGPAWKAEGIDGKLLDSADLKGKIVVVDFWATWCPPCVVEVPGYVALQKKYAAVGLVIMGLSVDVEAEAVRKFIEAHGINYPVALADDKLAGAFGELLGYPTTFVIDRAGMLRFRKNGPGPIEDLEQVVKTLL